jgi:hypothetical protein
MYRSGVGAHTHAHKLLYARKLSAYEEAHLPAWAAQGSIEVGQLKEVRHLAGRAATAESDACCCVSLRVGGGVVVG